jgi:hypothetical protein
MMRGLTCAFVLVASVAASAQESQFAADLRREGDEIGESCGSGFTAKALVGCIVTLATADPFHVAIGSLAPQNGMGFGLAFAERLTPNDRWRIGWNADAVRASSGAWRAGAYMKFVYRPPSPIVVVRPGSGSSTTPHVGIVEYPVLNVYVQQISLPSLTVSAGTDPFSEEQTIAGANAIYPLPGTAPFRAALVGELNGRWLTVRDATTGTTAQPSFAQFGEGVRIRPTIAERVRLNYLAQLQHFSSSDAGNSFRRLTFDLRHDIPLYRTVSSTRANDTNGPDECFESVGSSGCPAVSYSRNREGAIGVRLLAIRSMTGGDNTVPFYFQPTLGGSDLNGQRLLAGFDDYRFRGPNLIALQESVEHSSWGPFGAYLLIEQGKTTASGEGLGFRDLKPSYAVGLTIRAGGFPLVNLSFAWGAEGHHIIGTIDPTLLGGSARPSLY